MLCLGRRAKPGQTLNLANKWVRPRECTGAKRLPGIGSSSRRSSTALRCVNWNRTEAAAPVYRDGLMHQAKLAARGFRTPTNFIHIPYLRLSKHTHLPKSPFMPAVPLSAGFIAHRV